MVTMSRRRPDLGILASCRIVDFFKCSSCRRSLRAIRTPRDPRLSRLAGLRLQGEEAVGQYQVVTSFPDLKVQIVDSFPDLKVQQVTRAGNASAADRPRRAAC